MTRENHSLELFASFAGCREHGEGGDGKVGEWVRRGRGKGEGELELNIRVNQQITHRHVPTTFDRYIITDLRFRSRSMSILTILAELDQFCIVYRVDISITLTRRVLTTFRYIIFGIQSSRSQLMSQQITSLRPRKLVSGISRCI